MTEKELLERFEAWLQEGRAIFNLRAGGAPSAPGRQSFNPDDLITVQQAAKLLRCAERTMWRRVDEEPELSIKVGGNRYIIKSTLLSASKRV